MHVLCVFLFVDTGFCFDVTCSYVMAQKGLQKLCMCLARNSD